MNEIQLLARFLKERDIYTKCIKKMGTRRFDDFEIYSFFDELFSWTFTIEGYVFWYHTQLDFVKLLLSYNIDEKYFIYYNSLISEYTHTTSDYIWKSHKEYKDMILTEGRLGSSHPLKSS